MKNWLIEKGIPFSDRLLKPEIYSIIKQNKPPKVYAIDKIIESKGHMVVRLPPYHCDLNPIEMVWGITKGSVAKNNTTFKLEDIKEHIINALNEIPEATFKKTFEHTLKIEKSYWDSDGLDICPIVQPITINAASASVDSCSSSSSSYSSSSASSSEYSDSDSDE